MHLLFRRLRLVQHLEALRHIYFFHGGDILQIWMQAIFRENDLESTVKENTIAFVNSQFDLAIKLSLPSVQSGNQVMENEF